MNTDGLLYLGRAVVHPTLGAGHVSFEEVETVYTARILQATFANETLTGCAQVLADIDVSWRGALAYQSERVWTTLCGHHGACGYAFDETLVRKALAAAQLPRVA